MHLDVLDLRNFYYRSALGRSAQAVMRAELKTLWPNVASETVVGFGFAAPLLRPFLQDARRVISLMPGPQGVMPWPAGRPNISVLCEDTLWPLGTGQADKLLVLHGLETSENPTALLEECWRVLHPGGKVIFMVPNRSGLWSGSDSTPFGYGRPYSFRQLDAQLRRHKFVTERSLSTLYQPPSHKRLWRKFGNLVEKTGHKVPLLAPGGVLIVEASKQLRAPVGPGERVTSKRPLQVLEGLGGGVPEPARGRSPAKS